VENFRKLEIWRRSHALAIEITRHCQRMPWYEQSALASQMRRAATSVPFNIAEGCGRKQASRSNADLLYRLSVASGSLHELDSQVEFAVDVGYLDQAAARALLDEIEEIRRMLAAFIREVRRRDRHRP
jgi:four helix bundle protein